MSKHVITYVRTMEVESDDDLSLQDLRELAGEASTAEGLWSVVIDGTPYTLRHGVVGG